MKVKIIGNGIKKIKVDKSVVITGIICLTAMEIVALLNGINGTLFAGVVAIVATAIGVMIPTPKWINLNK